MYESRIVSVPQLGVNDEKAELLEWLVAEGEPVSNGDLLCVLETTKATYDVEAECSGYVAHLVSDHDEVLVNQPLAIIAPTAEGVLNDKRTLQAKAQQQEEATQNRIKATKKARDLALKHDIALENVAPSSGTIVRESDIIAHLRDSNSRSKPELHLDIPDGRTPVAVYGAGRGGATIQETLALGADYQAVCFVDDDRNHAASHGGLPVFHSSELPELKRTGIHHIATEIMRGTVRQRIKKQIEELNFELINVIHPGAFISPTVRMGSGNYIKAGAVVETNTVIGDCCILDNGAVIPHDNHIGNGCHIAPGATFGSGISLGDNTVVGIGASISTNVQIGRNCIIAVGTAVTQNVCDNAVVDGVPGKVIGKAK